MAATTKYLMAGSTAELERLRLQARVWEPEAEAMLDRIGVRPGWHVLDLGCGAMGVLDPLSRRVGATGRVVGVDNDPRQLAGAREVAARASLGNIEIVDADAYATALPSASFDLVHARFVFAPGGRDDRLLAEMVRLTRPGGVIAIQEPDASSWSSYPGNILWSMLRSEILAAFKRGGGDFDAGLRTRSLLEKAGFLDVEIRAAVLPITGAHPYKRLPVQFATSLRARILEGGRVNEAQLDRAIAECERIAADPRSMMMTFIVTQAWGRKPA